MTSDKSTRGVAGEKEVEIVLPDDALKNKDGDDEQDWIDDSVHEETESSEKISESFSAVAQTEGPWQHDKKTLKKNQKKLKSSLIKRLNLKKLKVKSMILSKRMILKTVMTLKSLRKKINLKVL